MNVTIPEQIDSQMKPELQSLMQRLLDLLREILSSVHEERLVIESEHISRLKELLDRRQYLLVKFEDFLGEFTVIVSKIAGMPENEVSFLQSLHLVEEHLLPEDVELHLLTEQLTCISKEMMGETNSLVHLLESKSALAHPRGLVLKKTVAQPARLAVGLADDDILVE